jgi:lysophospholipase L1-like esterase
MEFPTSANRVIGVEGSRQEAFELMQFAPSDTVAPIPRNNRRIIFFGDSFTDGQGADNAGDAYSYVAGDMLGFEDIFSSGAGGTGYVRTASSVKFGDRWADITNAGPWDVIVIAGGINDFGYAGITANVTAFMQKIRVGNPSAQMFVVGPWDNMAPAAPQTAYEPTKAAILAGIPANTGIRFIDAEGVVYEKGGDGVHPTTAGHKTLGNWLAAQIKAALGA